MAYGTILHVNMVGILAAVEEGLDRDLKGRPFVVAMAQAARSCVLDLSPCAYREGLRAGMPLTLARNLVPGLSVRAPNLKLCQMADEILLREALSCTPLVERAGVGHLFLDLAGTTRLLGPPEDAAQRIRTRILNKTGLHPTLALASTKTASKVATRVFRPGGFVALSSTDESALVRGQPVNLLPGVGPVLTARLCTLDINDIGGLADLTTEEAVAIGPRGPFLVCRARGNDNSPVNPDPPERRAFHGVALYEPDTTDPETLRVRLAETLSELAFALRRSGSGTHRVCIQVYYTDGSTSEASGKSGRLLSRDDELYRLALETLVRAKTRRVRIRRIGIELSLLDSAGPELDLFTPIEGKRTRLQTAVDRVRSRYGPGALVPGALYALTGRQLSGAEALA